MRFFPRVLFCIFAAALAVPATAASITPSQIGVVTTDLTTANAATTLAALGGEAGVSWTPGDMSDPGGPHNTNAYMQFNTSGYSGPISNAQLTLTAEASQFGSSPTATDPVTINVYAVTQAFSVGTVGLTDGIFWGTQPTNGGTLIASAVESSSTGPVTFSGSGLTALVQSWIDSPTSNHGLVLEAAPVGVADPSGAYIGAWFNGNATGSPPMLSFTTTAISTPEPSSFVLAFSLATSLAGLGWWRRHRRQG